MKNNAFLFMLLLNSVLFGQSNTDTISGYNCELLKKIFQEDAFYKLQSIDLNFADTIIIFDKANFFYPCHDLEINNKKIIIKNFDLLPSPLIGAWNSFPEYRERYRWYFILEKPKKKGKIVIVNFFKVLSNHFGFFKYKRVQNKFILIDYKIGQY